MSRRADKNCPFLLPGEDVWAFRRRQKTLRQLRGMTLDSLVQTHIRKNAARFVDIPPDTSGLVNDDFLPAGANKKQAREKRELIGRYGPLTRGERIIVEYDEDGTANVILVSRSQNEIGDIPDGADGDRWAKPGNTGDDEPDRT